jgi:DNA helicase HerA-like ATPase
MNAVTTGATAMQEEGSNATPSGEQGIRPMPAKAGASLRNDADANGGPFMEPPEYRGSIGRTTFDDRQSVDGNVVVVLPPENVEEVPSQSLVRVLSMPDRREYIASVTAGPFNEPDGLRADSPALIASAVHGALAMPRHHGRIRATLLGQRVDGSLMPARRRPKPNSPVHKVSDDEMSSILNLVGDVRLGLVYGHDSVAVRLPSIDKSVLPRHTAMVGTTGGGKSSGNGRYVSELQRAKSCVVLLDVEGEYAAINEPTDNQQLLAALRERGLEAAGIPDTHLYYLAGRDCANPNHPSKQEFCLRFDEISPYAFTEIMDLSQAQEDRLLRIYESAKILMRQLGIFPRKNNEKADNSLMLEVDEFERGWPFLTLEHLCYLVSGEINLAEGEPSEPPFNASGFTGRWNEIRAHLQARYGGGHGGDDDDGGKRRAGKGYGDQRSYKVLSARLARIRRLGIFDRGNQHLKYEEMIKPGRVNIIDLSDLDNVDVRNLAIAEILRGITERQQLLYDEAEKTKSPPQTTNVIIEEAHEFLSAKRIDRMPTLRDQLTRIAKRGRKRYLGLTFVTQSPTDLPDDVLGLVNNWVIYKIDARIISRIRSFVPNADDSLWTTATSLAPGQAIVSFMHMRRPVIGSIDPSPARLLMSR